MFFLYNIFSTSKKMLGNKWIFFLPPISPNQQTGPTGWTLLGPQTLGIAKHHPHQPLVSPWLGKAGENKKKTNKLWKKQQRNTASNFCVDIVSSDVVGSFNFSAQFSASNSHLLELWRKRTTPAWNWLPGCWEAACYKGYRLKVCSCNCVC